MSNPFIALNCLALAVFLVGCAQEVKTSGPVLSIEKRMVDLGEIHQGLRRHRFHIPISNSGDEILRIERIEVGCSCVGLQLQADEIAPGETVMATGFVSADKSGGQRERIKLATNDAANPISFVDILWKVDTGYIVNPRTGFLGDLEPGNKESVEIGLLESPSRAPLALVENGITCSHSSASDRVELVESGDKVLVTVKVAPGSESGPHSTDIVFSKEGRPICKSRVSWNVVKEFEVFPSVIRVTDATIDSTYFAWARLGGDLIGEKVMFRSLDGIEVEEVLSKRKLARFAVNVRDFPESSKSPEIKFFVPGTNHTASVQLEYVKQVKH